MGGDKVKIMDFYIFLKKVFVLLSSLKAKISYKISRLKKFFFFFLLFTGVKTLIHSFQLVF